MGIMRTVIELILCLGVILPTFMISHIYHTLFTLELLQETQPHGYGHFLCRSN
jgi:hypothetical protein